jgi:hypothetical protein
MLDVFAAPPRDRYQVLTEHRPGQLICEDTGLDIERTDDLVVLQVFQQGRSEDQKRALYAGLAEKLERSPVSQPPTSSCRSWATPARTGPSGWAGHGSWRGICDPRPTDGRVGERVCHQCG